MRAVSVALACSLLPAVASAEDNQSADTTAPTVERKSDTVIGGMDAPLGKWPDTAFIVAGGFSCTGTLIAPTVALTAGHCNDPSISAIRVKGNNLNKLSEFETIKVIKRVKLTQNDTTVLVLEKPSTVTPRALPTGWAQFDIKNGAPVQLVGYGTVNSSGSQGTDVMKEAASTVTDFDCSVKPGCSQFEIGAGGMGIDTCPGDSGGPMYLLTPYGDFLVGVTSRAYSNATRACGDGGIYGRPDQIIEFIEAAAGVPVARGPEPTLEEPLLGIRGDAAEAVVNHNDPKAGTSHKFEIMTQPAKGQAAVSEDGVVRVCIAQDATPGDSDTVVVKVTDLADANRAVTARLKISVAANEPVSGTCDPQAFGEGDSGGCCDSGGSGVGGSAALSLIALVVLRRRRR